MGATATHSNDSDVDTQEPVSRPAQDDIPSPEVGFVEATEEDVAETPPPKPASDMSTTDQKATIQQIMACINSGGDQSEDEEDDAPIDQPVDFGDEEEEEDDTPKKNENVNKTKKASTSANDDTPVKADNSPDDMVMDSGDEKTSPAPSKDEEVEDSDMEVQVIKPPPKRTVSKKILAKKPPAKKLSPKKTVVKKTATVTKAKDQTAAAKKKHAANEKETNKAKTIKKTTPTETKAKAKTPKQKSKKDKETSGNTKPRSQQTAQETSSPDSSQPTPKKKLTKQQIAKMQGKSVASKASSTIDAVVGKEKGHVKAKKTITKQDKSPNGKTSSAKIVNGEKKVKTFSKKQRVSDGKKNTKATAKTPESDQKKKLKSTKKKTPKKAKLTEESDEDGDVVLDGSDKSDVEETTVGDEEEDELVSPQVTKSPIIGNLACSSRDENCQALIEHAAHQLGRYHVVSYDANASWKLEAYIIGKETKRGWGILRALALGVPLVSDEWLAESISAGSWQDMKKYRSDRFGQSPGGDDGKIPTQTRLLEGVRVKIHCQGLDAADVRKVASVCGARIAETRIDIVVNDTGAPVEGGVNVTKKWLADSIESGVSMDYEPYLVKT